MTLIEELKDLPYIGYIKRQVKNQPTEAYLFQVKQIYQLLKNKKHIILQNKIITSGVVNKKHVKSRLRMEFHQ